MGHFTWALKPDWIRIPRIYQIPCSVCEKCVTLPQHLHVQMFTCIIRTLRASYAIYALLVVFNCGSRLRGSGSVRPLEHPNDCKLQKKCMYPSICFQWIYFCTVTLPRLPEVFIDADLHWKYLYAHYANFVATHLHFPFYNFDINLPCQVFLLPPFYPSILPYFVLPFLLMHKKIILYLRTGCSG